MQRETDEHGYVNYLTFVKRLMSEGARHGDVVVRPPMLGGCGPQQSGSASSRGSPALNAHPLNAGRMHVLGPGAHHAAVRRCRLTSG